MRTKLTTWLTVPTVIFLLTACSDNIQDTVDKPALNNEEPRPGSQSNLPPTPSNSEEPDPGNQAADLPPSAPGNLRALSITQERVSLAWQEARDDVGIVRYDILRNETKIGSSSTTTSYTDNSVNAGESYEYTVVAFDAEEQSARSTPLQIDVPPPSTNADTTPPTAVSSISHNTNANSVNLTWAEATDDTAVTSYQISRNGTIIATVTSTNYTDSGITESGTYLYEIAAFDAAGNSSVSSTYSIEFTVVDREPPIFTGNLSHTFLNDGTVELSWSSASDNIGIDRYEVYRDTSRIGSTSTQTFTDENVVPGSDYIYSVVALDAAGNTATSPNHPVSTPVAVAQEVKAFPSAEGFGAKATGGRGGRVIKVTNLNADGPGSLQEALNQNEPRIIVFEVGGVIEADLITVPYGNVTIAGQTAPGGITINGRLYGRYSWDVGNIIIRHIRIRPPEFDPAIHGINRAGRYDAMQFSRNYDMIFDHVSVAFGVDETVDFYEARNVTFQWSIVQEAAISPYHPDGTGHNYGLLNGPNGGHISIHHNLFVHNKNRNPALATGPAEVINNVMYNVRHAFHHHNPAQGPFNIIGNHMKRGPNDDIFPLIFDDENRGSNRTLSYYIDGNYLDDPGEYVGNVDNPWARPYVHRSFEWAGLDASFKATAKFDFSNIEQYVPVTTTDSNTAYNDVLNLAGAFPRDQIDLRDVQETIDRTGNWGARFVADLTAGLTFPTPPADTDNDGMADDWERANGLSTTTADHNTIMPSGYTAIEEYINQLADKLIQ